MNKPEPCGQDWLEMKPTTGGRICRQCSKVIVDFSKMNWKEIEEKQNQHNHSLCGMYSDKQLEYWGQELPASAGLRLVRTIAVSASLTVSASANAQTSEKNTKPPVIIQGIVRDGKTLEELPGAIIILKNTQYAVETDINGRYCMDISGYIDSIASPTLIISSIGYMPYEQKMDQNNTDQVANMKPLDMKPMLFSVSKPTFIRRVKNAVRKLFSKE